MSLSQNLDAAAPRAFASQAMELWRARPMFVFAAIASALTALRIAGLVLADANLGPDEAQYWFWSKDLSFGYYSKPPLIAWAIAATTAMFGDAEWAVRLSAPLFHLGTALFIFALARRLYGAAAGFWAGAGWLTLPGVWVSSALITTDAPLLFFWAAALFFFFRILGMREAKASQSGPLLALSGALGAAIGLGFLAKYAMIYFIIGAALALIASAYARRNFRAVDGIIACVVAGAFVLPNLIWNAQHDFRTISHTVANADWDRTLFHPEELGEFAAGQFGIFGPLLFLLLLWGAATLTKRLRDAGDRSGADLALLAFAAPPVLIVAAQALISRAHANWAAAAYPAAIILVTVWAMRARLGAMLKTSAGLHLAGGLAFLVIFSNFAVADALSLSNAVKRVRGWETQGAFVRERAAEFDAILVDDRELMGAVQYYARGTKPIVAWDSNHHVDDHYEAFFAYNPAKAPRALFVALDPEGIAVARRFEEVTPAGSLSVDLKRGRSRTIYLFTVSGYREGVM